MDWTAFIEALYWISGIFLTVVAIFGLEQINVLKSDIRTRNERAAMEKAIDSVKYWASIQARLRPFINNCEKIGLPSSYAGDVSDFYFSSLSEDAKELALKKDKVLGWSTPVNHMEAMAASYMTGVADIDVGFEVMGRDYCQIVKALYDVIAVSRRDRTAPLYNNIVSLYQTWKPKIDEQASMNGPTEKAQ